MSETLQEWADNQYINQQREMIADLQSTIATQADQIRQLKEDGERLAKVVKVRGDSTICYCGYPDFNDEHVPNCPIILHADLMKELEKREG